MYECVCMCVCEFKPQPDLTLDAAGADNSCGERVYEFDDGDKFERPSDLYHVDIQALELSKRMRRYGTHMSTWSKRGNLLEEMRVEDSTNKGVMSRWVDA